MITEALFDVTVESIESLVSAVNKAGGDIPLDVLLDMSMRDFMINICIPNRVRFCVKPNDKISE